MRNFGHVCLLFLKVIFSYHKYNKEKKKIDKICLISNLFFVQNIKKTQQNTKFKKQKGVFK